MPKYKANRDTFLSHECRTVKAGEEFTTVFPKVKTGKKDTNGKPIEVDMVLADNLELLAEDKSVKKTDDKKDEKSLS